MGQQNNRLVDIARLSGVSIGTVDRVIHGRGKVSENAKKRVNEAICQLNYKPNILARSLRLWKPIKIDVFIPTVANDEYWQKINEGINKESRGWGEYGIQIALHEFGVFNKESFTNAIKILNSYQPNGVILAPIHYKESEEFLFSLQQNNIPFVLFNSNISTCKPVSFIGQDLFQSGRVAASLVDYSVSEKKIIGIIHIDEDFHNSLRLKEKECGFLSFFENKGAVIKRFFLNPHEEKVQERLNLIIKDKELAALFVSTSQATSVVACELKKSKRDDLVLVGYDLLSENVRYLKEGVIRFLINQNPQLLAQTSLSYLLSHLIFNKKVPAVELFPLDIITKENVDSYLKFQQYPD